MFANMFIAAEAATDVFADVNRPLLVKEGHLIHVVSPQNGFEGGATSHRHGIGILIYSPR